jgi:hypothetical protein
VEKPFNLFKSKEWHSLYRLMANRLILVVLDLGLVF